MPNSAGTGWGHHLLLRSSPLRLVWLQPTETIVLDLGTGAVILGALATLGQFVYARSQTAIQRREEERAADAALAILNAEWFRLWSMAKQIQDTDLVQRARDGWLDPDDFEPIDQAGLAVATRRLSFATGALTAYALTTARDAALSARALVHLAQSGDYKRNEDLAQQVKDSSTEAAYLLEDALANSPRSRAPESIDDIIPMKSRGGSRIIARIKEQEASKLSRQRRRRWPRLIRHAR